MGDHCVFEKDVMRARVELHCTTSKRIFCFINEKVRRKIKAGLLFLSRINDAVAKIGRYSFKSEMVS